MGYLGKKATSHGTTASRVDDAKVTGNAYLVVNTGATTAYIGTDNTVTTGTGHAVAAGQAYPIVPAGTMYPQVWAITASGTASVEHHYVK